MPGIDISNIKQYKKASSQKTGIFNKLNELLSKDISFSGNKPGNKKKLNFYTDLHVLLASGIDFKTAFELIAENFHKKNDKKLIEDIKKNVINGVSISEALEKTGKFTMYEVFSVKIGEETGKLNDVLNELANFYKKRIDQKRKITSAFSYPIIVLLTAFGAIFFMMQFIVPMFEDVFKRFDNDLPALTQFIINASHSFKKYSLFIILFVIAIVTLIRLNRNNSQYKKYSSKLILKIPVFGLLIKKINLSRFCLGMELLLSSKTPILNAVQLMQKMITFYPITISLKKIENDLLHGSHIYESMAKFDIYEKRMISLVKVAEEVNQLDKVFTQLKEQYNSDVEYLAGNINSVMEPLLIIFIGIFVGLILVSMYLPMFQLSTGVSF
ncbi:MAG: type II secretion system F family protein [Bacteroidales bacterium]|nr:type II secretion system F family protein [Bacteroidales bacterium]